MTTTPRVYKPQRHRSPILDAYRVPPSVLGQAARVDIGYLRWSRDKEGTNLSLPTQEAGVRQLHTAYGEDRELKVLIDDGRSGREGKEHLRASYAELEHLIETDQVGTIYVYALTRLGRSLLEGVRIVKLAAAHGARVISQDFGIIDISKANGEMVFKLLMTVAEWEGNMAAERNRGIAETRKGRGELLGQQDYGWMVDPADKTSRIRNLSEPVDRIVELYDETRSLHATARAANVEGIPTRRGGPWSSTSVRMIVSRERPDLLPARAARGIKPAAPFVLYRLLRCHCGGLLTGKRATYPDGRWRFTGYSCMNARRLPNHGRASVSERPMMAWVRAAADAEIASQINHTTVRAASDFAVEREALQGRRLRLAAMYEDGDISREEKRERQAAIDVELERLAIKSRAVDIHPIDWDNTPPAHINAVLRAMWSAVELDEELRPVRALPALAG